MNEELKVIITADIKDFEKDVNKAEKEIEEFGKKSDKASDMVDNAFDTIKQSVSTAMKAATVAIGAAAAAIVGITESTRDYRNAQAKLETAFEAAGSDAETAKKVYKDLNGVLGDSDVAVEAANHLAKLTTNEKDLSQWTKIATGVYATFGDSLPIEGLTEAANETAKTGTVSGNLADALNWAAKEGEKFGVVMEENIDFVELSKKELEALTDAEKAEYETKKKQYEAIEAYNTLVADATTAEDYFNIALANCTTEQERQKLIMDTLSDSYGEAATKFEKANKDIINANKATDNWNESLANIGGAFEPVVTELKIMGTSILDSAQEPLEDLAEFIIDDLIPGVKKAANWVKDNKDIIIGVLVGMGTALVTFKAASVAAKLAEEGLTAATIARTAAQKALNLVMSATPLGLVTTLLAGVTAGIIAYTAASGDAKKAVEALTEEEKKLIEESEEAAEKFRELKEANDETISGYQSSMEHTKKLADELIKLADASGKVDTAEQTRAKFILNELNEALGTEYTMVDGVIQQYEDLQQSIYDVIAAKTANAMLEPKNEEYLAAIKAQDEALQAVVLTQKDYEAQVENVKTAEEEYADALAVYMEELAIARENNDYRSLASTAQWLDTFRANVDIEKSKLEEKKEAYDEASNNYKDYYDTINEYEEAAMLIQQGNYDEAIDMLKGKTVYFHKYSDSVSEATKKVVDDLYKEAYDAGLAAEETKKNFEDGVEGYTEEMVKESEQAYKDAFDAWSNAYDEANNIGKLTGTGLTKGFEAAQVPRIVKEAYDDSYEGWRGSYLDYKGLGKDMGKGAADGMQSAGVPNKSKSVYENTLGKWDKSYSDGKDVGEDLADGVKEGLESRESGLIASATTIIGNIWRSMRKEADSHSPSRKTMQLGSDMGAGLQIGIEDSTQDVVSSAKKMIQKTIVPIEGTITDISWNNINGIFDTSGLTAQLNGSLGGFKEGVQDILSVQWVNQLVDAFGANNTPIVLQVDGNTFAQTSINTINQLTRQTGKLTLNVI